MQVPRFSPRISLIEMAPRPAPRNGYPGRSALPCPALPCPALFVTTDRKTQGTSSDWKNLLSTTHTDRHHCLGSAWKILPVIAHSLWSFPRCNFPRCNWLQKKKEIRGSLIFWGKRFGRPEKKYLGLGQPKINFFFFVLTKTTFFFF